MSDTSILKQLDFVHDHVREKAEQHFNRDQKYEKYKVFAMDLSSIAQYASKLGDTSYVQTKNDVSFRVQLVDVSSLRGSTVISCKVYVFPDGHLHIDDVSMQSATL